MKKQSVEDQLRDVALHRELAAAIAARDPTAAEACADKLVDEPPTGFPPR
jgi:DNA-binding FadR family transcriptional regulator